MNVIESGKSLTATPEPPFDLRFLLQLSPPAIPKQCHLDFPQNQILSRVKSFRFS